MTKYLSKQPSWHCLFIELVAVAAILLAGCSNITTADISGTYVCSTNGVTDTLVLRLDGSFSQTTTFTNGGSWSAKGAWKFSGEIVEFDEFYEAFAIDPNPGTVQAIEVIPPVLGSGQHLWVERGKLIKNSVQPIWIKQEPGKK